MFLAFNGYPAGLQLRTDTYNRLTPVQQLQVARHPNRPTFLDIALNITDKFVELHGDRAGLDDPAMVAGIGSIDGVSFMMIGHQKGRNTKARGSKARKPLERTCLGDCICTVTFRSALMPDLIIEIGQSITVF